MIGRAPLVLVIGLASCEARHRTDVSEDVAVRHARRFVCDEIPNMLAVHVPPSIVKDTLRDAVAQDTLSRADLECLNGKPIPDEVMNVLRRRVRAE